MSSKTCLEINQAIYYDIVKPTKSRKPPSVRQKTSGPAMSVSWSICWSVPRNGFSTASV